MLRSTKDLPDLAIGDVKDLYFDDEAWAIHYFVVDTGSWLSSRKVLVSPMASGKPDWAAKLLPVSLTREQVRNIHDIDTDMPVTRQHETDYLDYYSYPYYWGGASLWGGSGNPTPLLPGYARYGSDTAARADADSAQARTESRLQHQDPRLRICNAVAGYQLDASDGEIGHVKGLLVDDESWTSRYLVVSTSNWWFGHEVVVAPKWI